MRKVLLATLLAASALAACGERSVRVKRSETNDGGPLKVVTQLECPDHQGPLTRVRTAPDGLSCDYAGPRGSEVTLRLIKLADGQGADAALAVVDRELNALMPSVAAKMAKGEAEAREADRKAEEADRKAEAADRRAEEAARRAAEADPNAKGGRDAVHVDSSGVKVDADDDKAEVHLPGLHVDADEDGAQVRIGGLRVDARDKSGNVKINSSDGDVDIRARDDAAEIRTRDKGQGVRLTYILVDDTPSPQGWRLVGYEARGPAGGPIVAAVVRSKERHEDKVFDAAKTLVKRNVGG
jgi:hypothetical protein